MTPKLAYLGPRGSHSYQCASDGFGTSVEYVERPTITDVFHALSPEVPFALMPQENSVYGTVTETYDLLRLPEVGQNKFIRGELILAVRHFLVVRQGVKLENVRRVLSHEQALGQCAGFLSKKLPAATRVKTASTSAAAQSLLSSHADDQALESAAICSAACATIFEGLEILCEDIQDFHTNSTRFYVFGSSLDAVLPPGYQACAPRKALVRISLQSSKETPQNRLLHLVTSTLLTTFGVPAVRIDRRPSLNAVPFEDVYFLELHDPIGSYTPDTADCHATANTMWCSRVKAGIERVQVAGGEASVLGFW
ncbi:PDT-domain-containing protein [Amylocystis lapponica]|nr:PDT-domain-containing protein [Amylocystis lapponica]